MSVVRLVTVALAVSMIAGGCTRKPSPEAAMATPMSAGPVSVEYPAIDPSRPMAPPLPPGSAMGVAMVTPAAPMTATEAPRPMAAPAPAARAGRAARRAALPQIPSGAAPGTYGAHLASYTKESDAQRGWQVLQRSLGEQLNNLQPRTMSVEVKGRAMIRLFATGFESVDQARQLCESLHGRKQYCEVMPLS